MKRPNEYPPWLVTRQWLQWRTSNNTQLRALNQRLLKKKEESHPHEQQPLLNSQNCSDRRNEYNSSRLASQNYGDHTSDREISREKNKFPPTTAIDTHSVMVKRDRIHPFAQNTFTRREKSLFHPGCETYPTIRCESVNTLTCLLYTSDAADE